MSLFLSAAFLCNINGIILALSMESVCYLPNNCLEQCFWPSLKMQTQTNNVMTDEIMSFDLKMEKICSKSRLDWAQVYLCTQGKTVESWKCTLGIYSKCYQICSLHQFMRKNFLRKVIITKMGQNCLGAMVLHLPITIILSWFSSLLHVHFLIPSYTFVLFT